MMDMPPASMDAGMGGVPMDGGDPNMMGGDPMMGGGDPSMMGGEDMNYGADFDAGVEADENTDPKKFIQQLTGKLSQSLRKYNQSLPQPDADLDKYVAGMIIKQAIEGLPQEDVTEILDKVNNGEEPQQPDMSMEQPPMDANGGMDMQQPDMGQMPQDQMPPNESVNRHGIKIDELLINKMDGSEKEGDEKQYTPNVSPNSYKKRPFVSPSFS